MKGTKWNVEVNAKMETNLPGVFCAGDVAAYPTKVTLIATAFADAVVAVNHAMFIDPTAKRRAPVSSHSDTFTELNKAFQVGE